MTFRWNASRAARPIAGASGPGSLPRWIGLAALAAALAVLAVAALVIPGWVPMMPRPIVRSFVEALLRFILIVYCMLVLTSLLGPPLLGWLLAWQKRNGRVSPAVARGFLISLACLASLLVLELGSTCWRAWMHRFLPLPLTFEPSSPAECRIVVVGESSALGEPYRPWLSVGQIVAWRLQESIPGRRFVCEIVAWLGDSLEIQHRKLAALRKRPDIVIIYSGHNEFAARFEEERDAWLDEQPRARLLQLAYRASLSSPCCRLAYEVISKNRLDSPPLSGRHHLIDPPLCSPSEWADIEADFSRRLKVIVAWCDRIGALPILIVPPAHEAGYQPSRSTLPPSVGKRQRERLLRQFEAAGKLESVEPDSSARRYEAILAQYPGFAEAHFRLGRLLERQGRTSQAGRHYLAALDHDGLPIRCPAPFRAAYQTVARAHPRSILIDGRRELAAASPTGLLGDSVIQDTHHPTLRGYVALAGAILREIQRRNLFDRSRLEGRPLDPSACARHFGVNCEQWATVCERTSEHYRRVAGYRYDPTERLDESRRYAEAARRFQSGKPVEDLGLAGISLEPAPPPPEF
jgi:hypothetical protein